MNGQPLPVEHGFPVRLIAPGWYGVANVKWLKRIELIDHRYAGRFMARDYVTFRERTDAAGNTTWTFQNVGPYRLKSAPAKVTRKVQGTTSTYRVIGVAWGGPIARVEVSIDGGPWRQAAWSTATPTAADPRPGVELLVLRLGAGPRRAPHRRLARDRHPRSDPAGAGRPDHHRPSDLLGKTRSCAACSRRGGGLRGRRAAAERREHADTTRATRPARGRSPQARRRVPADGA